MASGHVENFVDQFSLLCRLSYIHRLNDGLPLWRKFPEQLRDKTGANRYVQLFHQPFDERRLTPEEKTALRLSLLKAIPPPSPAQAAFALHLPEEVHEISILKLIDHVIDLASGYVRLPANVGPQREVVTHSLLPTLAEKAGVDLCKWCVAPQRDCTCPRNLPTGPVSQVPVAAAVQVMTVTASMAPVTTLSTSYGGSGAAGPTPSTYPSLLGSAMRVPVATPTPQIRQATPSTYQMPPTPQRLGEPASVAPTPRQSRARTTAAATGGPSPPRPLLAGQGFGRGGVIRSRSASATAPSRPVLGRGQQPVRPQEPPQGLQVDQPPGPAQASGGAAFNPQYVTGQDLIQFATASLQGSGVESAPTGQKSSYADFVRSHGNSRPRREPLGLPTAEGSDRRAAKYRKPPAQGMIKDLTRILQDHMDAAPELSRYTHDERAALAKRVTSHMVDHKIEWLLDREKNPLKYMRYVSDLFLRLCGVCLPGLDTYTDWIRAGTFIHGSILRRGELSKCPHLIGQAAPPPTVMAPSLVSLTTIKKEYEDASRNPKTTPAELAVIKKRLVGHYRGLRWFKQADDLEGHTPAAKGATAAPVDPAPMELDDNTMGAGGDAPTWAEMAEAEEKAKSHKSKKDREGFTQINRKNHKRQRSDGSQQGRVVVPFPLDADRRVEAVLALCREAASKSRATCPWILDLIQERYPRWSKKEMVSVSNMLPVIITEWQLTCAARDDYGVGPVLPDEILKLLPELEPYIGGNVQGAVSDFRQIARGNSLRFAVFLHRLDMYALSGSDFELSMAESDHHQGRLLGFYLSAGVADLTYEDVLEMCLRENKYENRRDLDREQEKGQAS